MVYTVIELDVTRFYLVLATLLSVNRPIARNFNWVVQHFFKHNLWLFIVDLFGKIMDFLFERGVLPHLENPPGYKPCIQICSH